MARLDRLRAGPAVGKDGDLAGDPITMQRLWFVTNIGSGSATPAKCVALEAIFAERGLTLAGRTRFPDESLPDAAALADARVDTLVLFAGDGTINAALCRLAAWDGAVLILPGGTMNLLAKALHATLDPAAIIAAAHAGERQIALPFVEAGPYRGFVGVIVGPAAGWVRAREAARDRRLARLIRAARLAWRRSFGPGVRIAGAPGLRRRYQAIFVTPAAGAIDVAAVDARDWRTIADLGWSFVTGDWVSARAVDVRSVPQVRLRGSKPVMALFDGEPERLEAGTAITGGRTAAVFLTTRRDPAA